MPINVNQWKAIQSIEHEHVDRPSDICSGSQLGSQSGSQSERPSEITPRSLRDHSAALREHVRNQWQSRAINGNQGPSAYMSAIKGNRGQSMAINGPPRTCPQSSAPHDAPAPPSAARWACKPPARMGPPPTDHRPTRPPRWSPARDGAPLWRSRTVPVLHSVRPRWRENDARRLRGAAPDEGGTQWYSEAPRGTQWHSEALSGTQRHSEATQRLRRGTQRPSVTLASRVPPHLQRLVFGLVQRDRRLA